MSTDPPAKKKPRKPKPLTVKQIRFCQLYVEGEASKSANATQALIDAGIPHTNRIAAGTAAWELLKNPQIQQFIHELRDAACDAAKATVERIAQGMARIAFANRAELFDSKGRLLPPDKWPADVAATVESIESEELYEVQSEPGKPKRKELVGYTRKVRTARRGEMLKLLAQWRRMVGQDADQGKATGHPPLVVGGDANPDDL